jgi:ribokinase
MLMVFGSINMDISVPVPRLPLPGETLLGGAASVSPGGKGANQAHAAQRFGGPTMMVGAVGDDAFADTALDNLRLAGSDVRRVRHLAGARTGLACINVAAGGENAIVVAPGANSRLRAHWVSDEELASCRSLLLQLEVPAEESVALARRARAVGCRTLLNAAPWSPGTLPPGLFDWLIVNAGELRQACTQLHLQGEAEDPAESAACTQLHLQGQAEDPAESAESASRLAARLQCRVLLTLGSSGALIADGKGVQLRRRALRVRVVDTTGAGDTCAGVFAAALTQGFSEARALDHAVAAAGLACTRRGAQAAQPTRDQIEHALSTQELGRA